MDEQKNRSLAVVIVIIVIVLGIVAYLVAGAKGLAGVMNFMKWGLIAVFIIGLAVWGVWYLFIRKVRDDRVALNAQRIVEQSKLTKPDFINDLWLSGDFEHQRVRLGKIIGYCQVKNILGEYEDVYAFKKAGFPMSMFEEAKAIRIKPQWHTKNIGDVIIWGISLVAHGGFYYVNDEHLDTERIDRTIKTEVIRQYTMDVLRDVKIISDMAVGINPEQTKYIEGKSLLKIPSRSEPVAPQQGGYESAPR